MGCRRKGSLGFEDPHVLVDEPPTPELPQNLKHDLHVLSLQLDERAVRDRMAPAHRIVSEDALVQLETENKERKPEKKKDRRDRGETGGRDTAR